MQNCLPELFCVLRYCNLDCTELDALIQWGFETSDPAVFRHCLGMLLSWAEDTPQRVATLVQPCLDHESIASVVEADNLASICYIRICSVLYEATKESKYLAVLCQYAQHPADSSSLLAMELLYQLPYDVLQNLNVNGAAGSGGKLWTGN